MLRCAVANSDTEEVGARWQAHLDLEIVDAARVDATGRQNGGVVVKGSERVCVSSCRATPHHNLNLERHRQTKWGETVSRTVSLGFLLLLILTLDLGRNLGLDRFCLCVAKDGRRAVQ